MADTSVPPGSPATVKTWGKKPPKKPTKGAAKTVMTEPARCSQFCSLLHEHSR